MQKMKPLRLDGPRSDGNGIIKVTNQIILHAIRRRSRIVRIPPSSGNKFFVFEGNGTSGALTKTGYASSNLRASVIARLKIMGNTALSLGGVFQSGNHHFTMSKGVTVPIKITSFPAVAGGEEIVLSFE